MALPRSSLASFPDDVVEEILTRLPPKPLVRFRCVSRCWKSNIADPKFIEKHLTVNKAKSLSDYYNNNVGYLLWGERRMPLIGEHISMESDLFTVVCNTDGPLTEISRGIIPSFFIKGFCNGIFYSVGIRLSGCTICPGYYRVCNPVVILCNPSIRKEKGLPPVLNDDRFETCAYQLAFPTSQNDLKFLVFGRSIEKGAPSKELGAQIYTLSTDSWSSVELQVDSLDIESVGPITRIARLHHLFYNGALHFTAVTSQGYKFILCCDIDDEEFPFREIKLPPNYSNGLSLKLEQLVVFKGSLALIAFGQDEAESIEVCRIWVMSEYGLVDSSWTPIFSVPLSGVEDFLGCTGSGELVIKKSGNQVFLFDPENQNEKDFGIQNLTPVEHLDPLVFTANLIESLVLLKP
ncbi:hypothetical protein RGQ29_018731 [Quercus rubra]|uniref:F-box domain-containing protein n=1 Tax=Quercus rubra TaxID=3512 RepID=A0AAN7IUW3_QUERU|nr:hypothetical protein RGQ29_018731 [Quercus rubra]